ncbi:MAG: CPBP family intramembrane metalloprotease [Planctomycetaceae bacterium]|jgi:membrane protease YdiL (CAAX protease family)|nr:CPBP family intramembrane metalloprotease [Planctomycetaceae bacterium]
MTFFQQAVIFEISIGVFSVAAGVFCGFPFWQNCSFAAAAFLQIGIAAVPLILTGFVLDFVPFEGLRKVERFVGEMVHREMADCGLLHFIVLSALAGFGEEFFFRGLLQDGLVQYLGTPQQTTVLIVVSLLFALAHNVTRTYAVLAFLMSLYFGFLLTYTQNLFVPVAVHGLYDLFCFLYIKYRGWHR